MSQDGYICQEQALFRPLMAKNIALSGVDGNEAERFYPEDEHDEPIAPQNLYGRRCGKWKRETQQRD